MQKTLKTMLRLAVAAAMVFGFGKAYAFHSGGVAECGGCHSMHSPQDTALGFLLIGSDQSSTCLTCHNAADASPAAAQGSYHISTDGSLLGPGLSPNERTPGGDFGWLKKTYTFVVRGNTTIEAGQTHGHNIVAADFGYIADSDNATSPGGSYTSTNLSCISCHDMHGQTRRLSTGAFVRGGIAGQATAPIVASGSYNNSPGNTAANPIKAGQAVGVYRLLWGGATAPGGAVFNGIPAAVAPSTYNRSESTTQTRVAYGVSTTNGGESWGNWCATCHGAMHSNGNYVHPIDQQLGSVILGNYNNYVSSGDLSGQFTGNHVNQGPFLSLAPFATNSANFVTLGALAAAGAATAATLAGPADGDQVMCLSCHRAHASAFPEMIRWQMEGEFITVADTATGLTPIWPGTDNGAPVQFARGRTSIEQAAGYYDRPATFFGVYNRVLCNKCHAKD
jgi:predicted CXXCH cytochrome family protein